MGRLGRQLARWGARRGVALGDSWISPVDYVLAWAPFLKAWSLLEDKALTNVSQLALETQQAVGNGNLTRARPRCGRRWRASSPP